LLAYNNFKLPAAKEHALVTVIQQSHHLATSLSNKSQMPAPSP